MFDVVAIGSAVYDAFIEADLKKIADAATASGASLRLPLGEKISGKKISFEIGGNAVNAGVTFGRQGYRVGICARLGNDVFGEEIKRRLSAENVKLDFIELDRKLPTSFSTVFLSGGERTIINFLGSGNALALRKIPAAGPRTKWFYVSLPGESYQLWPKIVSLAKKQSVKIAFNPTGYHIKKAGAAILKSLPAVDFLVLNETEAAELTGIDFKDPQKAFRKLDRTMPGILAVTYGVRGAAVSDGRRIYRTGIFKNRRVADRTGAGDAFASGFVAGLMRADLKTAIRLGLANAASVVEAVGANKASLTRSEFEKSSRWSKVSIKMEKI
ncbi:MAG: carbohydrate kinase family protein [Patescibacteria group bacterium]|nr:carbohydrate kinase family protein [Patescibacteria group bacterium]MCL5261804.1 carbohydrate kinase family protein [Patescibacteria group bacterium]